MLTVLLASRSSSSLTQLTFAVFSHDATFSDRLELSVELGMFASDQAKQL
jgi:hypothetical protein